jgi:hypothetical protein
MYHTNRRTLIEQIIMTQLNYQVVYVTDIGNSNWITTFGFSFRQGRHEAIMVTNGSLSVKHQEVCLFFFFCSPSGFLLLLYTFALLLLYNCAVLPGKMYLIDRHVMI